MLEEKILFLFKDFCDEVKDAKEIQNLLENMIRIIASTVSADQRYKIIFKSLDTVCSEELKEMSGDNDVDVFARFILIPIQENITNVLDSINHLR